jgi:subfamily B ATP-binding cassette protein MsbA
MIANLPFLAAQLMSNLKGNLSLVSHSSHPEFTSDTALYIRLLGYLKPYRGRFFLGMLASIPAASMDGAVAWGIGPLLDSFIKTQNYAMLMTVPLIVVGATVFQGISFYLSTYCNNYVGTAISRDLRSKLFEQLSGMELAYFKKNSTGELYSRYVSDPATLQQAIVSNLQDFVLQLFTFVGLAVVLIYRNWIFAIVALGVISTITIPLQLISRKVRSLDHESNDNLARMVSVFTEAITQAKLMIGFQLEDYQRKRFSQALAQYFSISMRILKAGTWLKPIMQLIAALGIAAIVVFGAVQVQNKAMTAGALASFMLALIFLYKPVKTLANIMNKVQRLLAPAERVFEKLDTRSGLQEEIAHPLRFERFETLTLENVGFQYEPGKAVLKDINFTVDAGEIIAFIGPSGGGKSTLVDLIPRFMDVTSGEIRVNGAPVKNVSLDWLRSQVAIVTQEPLLIDASIRENIRLGKLDATDAEIWDAVESANLRDFIEAAPRGLETPVGSSGGGLSGGQRQRVAIARAFLKNAPLLILDEATSALDNESEAKVQDALVRIMQNRTVFLIAHRLSTVRCATRILVLNQGRIVESGTHDDLLSLEGLYHKLYHLQFRTPDQLLLSVPESF